MSISLKVMPPRFAKPLCEAAWPLAEYGAAGSAAAEGETQPGCCANAVEHSAAMPVKANSGKGFMCLRLRIAP
jgi:hypothetical protein